MDAAAIRYRPLQPNAAWKRHVGSSSLAGVRGHRERKPLESQLSQIRADEQDYFDRLPSHPLTVEFVNDTKTGTWLLAHNEIDIDWHTSSTPKRFATDLRLVGTVIIGIKVFQRG